MNRRDFLKATGGAAAFLSLAGRQAYAFSNSMPLAKFTTPFRGVSLPPYTTPGIPVLLPDQKSLPANSSHPNPLLRNGVDHYSIVVGQYQDQLHPSLPPTTLWGYADIRYGKFRHLGGVIVAQRNKPSQLSFSNILPTQHILPVDRGAFFPDAALHQNAVATHLHGGFVPWISDGGPYDWWMPGGTTHGASFQNNDPTVTYPCVKTGEAEYYYPNQQGARMMWYHDHAHDLTRLNAYAGIATAYILRDATEPAMNLPQIELGGREIPLVFQDKIFKNGNPTSVKAFPQYELPVGGLWYPYVYDRTRWTLNGRRIPATPSCIAEMFGDTMLCNGVVCPTVTLEPTRYRFRILNACNARFVNLQLIQKDQSAGGISFVTGTTIPNNASGPAMVQIGTEGGFLPAPVTFQGYNKAIDGTGTSLVVTLDPANGNPTFLQHNLLLAPAERADVIIDFTNSANQDLILYTDCPAPFPGGDPINDYLPTAATTPDTRSIMHIHVAASVAGGIGAPPEFTPNFGTGNGTLLAAAKDPAFLVPQVPGVPTLLSDIPAGTTYTVRDLTLNEDFDSWGRLIQMVGTTTAVTTGKYGRPYAGLGGEATEVMNANAIEVWRIANTTADTHPMHFHLVNFQIMSRQVFNVAGFLASGNIDANLDTVGGPKAPDTNELGWKETIRMNPGEVVTMITQFTLPQVPFTTPSSDRASAMGVTLGTGQTTVHEYVYHCHILEHEEHDMMRPLIVKS